MGDRANIVCKYNSGAKVCFYTHWTGYNLDATLAAALARGKSRWNDDMYLARIIFCEMVREDVDGTTGFGIGPEPGDNSYGLLVVDLDKQTVCREPDTRPGFEHCLPKLESDLIPLSFEDYIAKHAEKSEETVSA